MAKKLTKIYISFSIHGTNCFIVAVNEKWDVKKLTSAFKIVESRRPKFNLEKDGHKIEWSGLKNKKTGEPYKSPQMVLKRFSELEKMGFTIINREGFVARHFKKK